MKKKCLNCGGEVQFDPESQKMKCTQCDSIQEFEQELSLTKHKISDYTTNVKEEEKTKNSEQSKVSTMECKSCGATIELDEHITSSACPYCDSKIVLAEKAVKKVKPDGLRPFAVEHKNVKTLFKKWLSKLWFAPNALKRIHQLGKINGMYLPYWAFDAIGDCDYTAEGGIDRTETYTNSEGEEETRTVTDWYSIRGSIVHSFKNYLMRASKTIKDSLLKALGGFNLMETVAFDPSYLTGYGSEVFQIDMPDAYVESQSDMESDLQQLIKEKERKHYDQVRGISMNIDWSEEYYRLLMLPVYSMPYFFKGKTYQILVNGETGEIVGDRPYSAIKITIAVIISLAIIAGGVWLYYKYK